MKIIDVISLDYNGSNESHNLHRTIEAAVEETERLIGAGHEKVRAEFVDEEKFSKEALRLVGTGTPCHLYKRKDGKYGVTRK